MCARYASSTACPGVCLPAGVGSCGGSAFVMEMSSWCFPVRVKWCFQDGTRVSVVRQVALPRRAAFCPSCLFWEVTRNPGQSSESVDTRVDPYIKGLLDAKLCRGCGVKAKRRGKAGSLKCNSGIPGAHSRSDGSCRGKVVPNGEPGHRAVRRRAGGKVVGKGMGQRF